MSKRNYDDAELLGDSLQNPDDAKWGTSVKNMIGHLTPPPPAKAATKSSAYQMALDAALGIDKDDDDDEEEEEVVNKVDPEAEARALALQTLEKTLSLLKNPKDLFDRANKAKGVAEIKAINKEAKILFSQQDDESEEHDAKRPRPTTTLVEPDVLIASSADVQPAKNVEPKPVALTVTEIVSQPPFGVLHYVFGSKFVAELAQCLTSKGAQSVVGTLEQNSFLTNLALAVVELARPDIVDESAGFKSKSSSVSDKETVTVLRKINEKPNQLAAQVEAKRLAQLQESAKNADGKFKRLFGVASLMAADVALNACIVVAPDRTQVAVAIAIGAHKKHKFAKALAPLTDAGLVSKNVVDAGLEAPWRVTATRLSLLPCSPDQLLKTASGATNKPQKRFRVDEQANVVFPPPPLHEEASSLPFPPPTKFSMPIKVFGSFGRVLGDSENVFKYSAKEIIKVYGREITLLPNGDMMALFSMIFEALNTHLQIHDLIAPNYQFHLTMKNFNLPKTDAGGKPVKKEFSPVKVLPGVFSCITESSVASKSKKYYEEHPDEVRSGQTMFVQRNREIAFSYATGKNSTEREVVEFGNLVLPVAHILFGFLRLDDRLAKQPVGEAAVHPAGRVVESSRERIGVDVQLGCNELPVGVWFRMPDLAKTLLTKMWQAWLAHLKLTNADGALIDNAETLFPERYREAKYGEHQWIVDYLKPSTKPTPEKRAEFREIMVPVMYALFPPTFMGEAPDKK